MNPLISFGISDINKQTGAAFTIRLNPEFYRFEAVDRPTDFMSCNGYELTILGVAFSVVATALQRSVIDDLSTFADDMAALEDDLNIPHPTVNVDWQNELMLERLTFGVYVLERDGYLLENTVNGSNKSDDTAFYTPELHNAFLFTFTKLMDFAQRHPAIYAKCRVCRFDTVDVVPISETL